MPTELLGPSFQYRQHTKLLINFADKGPGKNWHKNQIYLDNKFYVPGTCPRQLVLVLVCQALTETRALKSVGHHIYTLMEAKIKTSMELLTNLLFVTVKKNNVACWQQNFSPSHTLANTAMVSNINTNSLLQIPLQC